MRGRGAGLAAMLLAATGLPAQGVARPSFGISAGVDARREQRLTFGTVAADWRFAAPGLGVRAEATYGERQPERSTLYPPCAFNAYPCGPLHDELRTRIYGASMSAMYTVGAWERVRPYIVSGVGVFHTEERFSRTVDAGCPIEMLCTDGGSLNSHSTTRWTRAALHAGAGVSVRVARVYLVAEARYMAAEMPDLRGVGGGVPVSLGVRF